MSGWVPPLLLVVGVFTVVVTAADAEWYFRYTSARHWVRLLGRGAARWTLLALGVFLMGMSAVLWARVP